MEDYSVFIKKSTPLIISKSNDEAEEIFSELVSERISEEIVHFIGERMQDGTISKKIGKKLIDRFASI